jgi:hypothetical protein
VPERAFDLRKRRLEALLVYPMGVSKRCRFGSPQSFGSQVCDLRKRVQRTGLRRPPRGIGEEVWVRATVLARQLSRLTCQYGRGGGMQSLWKPTPSRLAVVA